MSRKPWGFLCHTRHATAYRGGLAAPYPELHRLGLTLTHCMGSSLRRFGCVRLGAHRHARSPNRRAIGDKRDRPVVFQGVEGKRASDRIVNRGVTLRLPRISFYNNIL